MRKRFQFDRAYYERYYERKGTRVTDAKQVEKLARFVCSYLEFLELPVRRALDVGCGIGLWRDALTSLAPKLRYSGLEYSEYLCERYGWTQGSVVTLRTTRPYDLVICQGVLQYLSDREAAVALKNLARATKTALYLEALTREDWDDVADRSRTDGAVYLRKADFYRRALGKELLHAGGGLWLKKSSEARLFALETC